MVLSENNEPLMKSDPAASAPNPGQADPPTSPDPLSNPGERLRSIEMASSQKKRRRINFDFLQVLKKVKVRKDKLLPAFHNISSAILITVNIILLVVILLLTRQVFALKNMIVRDVMGGLYINFGEMDKATITSAFEVNDNLLIDFPLQINQETEVVLTKDTVINGARITLSTGGLNIVSAPSNITLPAGSRLPIQLTMTVPVSASVPINLNVPINIPLADTELHQPFTNMQEVVQPYLFSFMDGPITWQELPACKVLGFICDWWFK